MSINLGRTIRMTVKNGAVKSTNAVLNTKPVRKVSGLMLTAYLKNKAMMKGQKLSFIAEVFEYDIDPEFVMEGAKLSFVAQVFAVIFDVACIPIEWCLIYPAQKLWNVLKVKWAGARFTKALPAK